MSRWLHLSYFLVLLLTVIPLFVFVRNHLPSSTEINCSQAKSTDRELKTLLASLRESELKALLANAGSEAATTVNTKQPQPKFVALNSTQLPSLSAGRLADAAESEAEADADAGADAEAEADAESDGESRTGDRDLTSASKEALQAKLLAANREIQALREKMTSAPAATSAKTSGGGSEGAPDEHVNDGNSAVKEGNPSDDSALAGLPVKWQSKRSIGTRERNKADKQYRLDHKAYIAAFVRPSGFRDTRFADRRALKIPNDWKIRCTVAQLAHWRSVHPSAFVPLKASGAFTNKVLEEETTPATKKKTDNSDDETAELKLSIGGVATPLLSKFWNNDDHWANFQFLTTTFQNSDSWEGVSGALRLEMQFVIRELKRLIELTAKTIGIPMPVWSVSEGTLIAALRWGGLWGEVRDYGLDLADDDLDFVLLLDNVTMFSKFSETFAQLGCGSGNFGEVNIDHFSESFGMDTCGSIQLDFRENVLIDINVVLRDDPMRCVPCRLHPSADQSVICQKASQTPTIPMTQATLFGEAVPALAWPHSLVYLAVLNYWVPDGPSVSATLSIAMPSIKRSNGKERKLSFSAVSMLDLKKSAEALHRNGFASFWPLLELVPEGELNLAIDTDSLDV